MKAPTNVIAKAESSNPPMFPTVPLYPDIDIGFFQDRKDLAFRESPLFRQNLLARPQHLSLLFPVTYRPRHLLGSAFVREAPPFCHTAEIQSQNPTKLLERIHDIDDKPTTIRKSEWIVQRINVSVCPCINSKRIGFNVPFDPWVIVPEDVVVQPRFGIEVLSGK